MKKEVLIYMKSNLISMNVVVPAEYAGDFMVKFGETFACSDVELGRVMKKVDDYYSHGGGEWHVTVSVDKEQEGQLLSFIDNFSHERQLSFRDAGFG